SQGAVGRARDAGARAASFVPADRLRCRVCPRVACRAGDAFAARTSGEASVSGLRHLIASVLMDLCAAVLPTVKDEWLRAMRAEAAHIGDQHAIGFAAGCLLACFKERLRYMANIPASARYGLVAGMGLCAGFAARAAMHMRGEHGLTAAIFGGVATSYALAAVWSMLKGGRGLIEAAVILLVLNLAAANATEISAFNGQLISAVAFEGVVIWVAVLGFSFLFARIPRLPAMPDNSRTNQDEPTFG